MEGTSVGHLVQPPCRSRVTYSRLHRTASRWVLNISREGDSTTSLGSLFQCSITLRGKKFFLMFRRNCLRLSWCPLPLVLCPLPLVQILICAFPSPVPAHCRCQSGTAWCCLAAAGGTPAPSTQHRETQYQFCIFNIISLLINIISIINVISKTSYIQFVGFSPFSSFSVPLVGGWGLTESLCHSAY